MKQTILKLNKKLIIVLLSIFLMIPTALAINTEECLGEVKEDVRLISDVYMGKGRYCFLIKEQEDLQIDCDGYAIINERKSTAKKAIWAVESEDIEVRDCKVIGFEDGINFNNCVECKVTGKFKENDFGVFLFSASDNSSVSIEAEDNIRNVYILGSEGVQVEVSTNGTQRVTFDASHNSTIVLPEEDIELYEQNKSKMSIYIQGESSDIQPAIKDEDYFGFKLFMIILIIIIITILFSFLYFYRKSNVSDDSQEGNSDEFKGDLPGGQI